MRHTRFAIAALFMIATAASAAAAEAPDYSRQTILKVLNQTEEEEASRLVIRPGAIDYTTDSTRYQFVALLPSLPYAGPYGARFLPNALVLTGVVLPYQPGQYTIGPMDYDRTDEEEREYRRVMKIVAKR